MDVLINAIKFLLNEKISQHPTSKSAAAAREYLSGIEELESKVVVSSGGFIESSADVTGGPVGSSGSKLSFNRDIAGGPVGYTSDDLEGEG